MAALDDKELVDPRARPGVAMREAKNQSPPASGSSEWHSPAHEYGRTREICDDRVSDDRGRTDAGRAVQPCDGGRRLAVCDRADADPSRKRRRTLARRH